MKALEIFKSHQGEGKYTGTLMTFIRFKTCKRPFSDTLCDMCDTMTKMTSCIEMDFQPKDLDRIVRDSNYNICFTGGEPTLYLKDVKEIVDYFKTDIISHTTSCVHFETNGFRLKELLHMVKESGLNDDKYFIAFSPKFFTEDQLKKHIENLKENEEMFSNNRLIIKIVCGKDTKNLCNSFLNDMPNKLKPQVYIMPMGVNETEIKESMPMVSKLSMKYKVNISDRLHIIHTFM